MNQNKIWGKNIYPDPNFFRGKVSSAALNSELKIVKNINSYLKKNRGNMIPRNLPTHLKMLLDMKGLKKADVARESQLDRKYVYQIFDGTKTPSRDKLIAIAFGLHLYDEETQTMLKLSGNRELYVRDERDAIILFSLQRDMNIIETNGLLYDHGFKLLGSLDD